MKSMKLQILFSRVHDLRSSACTRSRVPPCCGLCWIGYSAPGITALFLIHYVVSSRITHTSTHTHTHTHTRWYIGPTDPWSSDKIDPTLTRYCRLGLHAVSHCTNVLQTAVHVVMSIARVHTPRDILSTDHSPI